MFIKSKLFASNDWADVLLNLPLRHESLMYKWDKINCKSVRLNVFQIFVVAVLRLPEKQFPPDVYLLTQLYFAVATGRPRDIQKLVVESHCHLPNYRPLASNWNILAQWRAVSLSVVYLACTSRHRSCADACQLPAIFTKAGNENVYRTLLDPLVDTVHKLDPKAASTIEYHSASQKQIQRRAMSAAETICIRLTTVTRPVISTNLTCNCRKWPTC